jgi:hypothetical protein
VRGIFSGKCITDFLCSGGSDHPIFSGKNKCQRNLRARCAARRLNVLLAREHFPDFPDLVLIFFVQKKKWFSAIILEYPLANYVIPAREHSGLHQHSS